MRLQVLRASCSYLHKLGCQYGVSANQPLPGGLGSCSKKKERAVKGGLGQSELILVQGLGGGGGGYRYSVQHETRPTSRSLSCCRGWGGEVMDRVFSMKQGPPPGHCRVAGVGGGRLWTECSA